MKDLLSEEKKMCLLVEKRGVAGNKWKSEISRIGNFIRDYMKTNPNGQVFSVPENLANVFPFLGKIEIECRPQYNPYLRFTGSGSFGSAGASYSPEMKKIMDGIYFSDGKLQNGKITLSFYYNDNEVFLRTVLGPLYHEINHAYDMYIAHYRNSVDRWKKTSNISIEWGRGKKIIDTIFYRLFSYTEFNALVASVYGDLEGMNSSLETFQKDYKITQAYLVCANLFEKYEETIDSLTGTESNNLYRRCRLNNVYIPMRQNTVSQFKNGLKQKTRFLLSRLLREIGRVASLYYEDKYNERLKNNNGELPPDKDIEIQY